MSATGNEAVTMAQLKMYGEDLISNTPGIQVDVASTAGATVHYTKTSSGGGVGVSNAKVVDSDGHCLISIPEYGTYTFYATLDGSTSAEVEMTFDMLKLYTLSIPFSKTYGVRIATGTSDPASAVTYTDDAVGKSAGWANWKNEPIFKNIKPCVVKDGVVQYYLNPDNFTQKAEGGAATINSTSAGDVMIEIPKIGYKITTSGSNIDIQVTDDPNADGFCYDAHSKNSVGDCDKIYIGAYLGYNADSKLYSISGVSPTVNISLTNARKYATARGDGYELFSFYPLTLLQCLFLIIFKNRNSQAALGQGYTGASSESNTGATNSNAFTYGSSSDTTHVKFLGIEDFWGNCYYWVDGIYLNGSRKILTYYKNMSGTDNGSNYQYSENGPMSNQNNYLSQVIGSNHGGFVAKQCSGSSSTYYCDYADASAGCCAFFGGYWYGGADAGAFRLAVDYDASSSYSGMAARLVYKHVSS